MDEEFDRRWRGGLPPFDGVTLYQDDVVRLSVLRPVFIVVVEMLSARCDSDDLFRVHDWHEHDGFIAIPEPSSWRELQVILESDQALRASSTRDTYVSTGYFPPDRSFYLRIYIPDDSDLPPDYSVNQGLFDVTCDEVLAGGILQAARQAAPVEIHQEPARLHFDRRYRG